MIKKYIYYIAVVPVLLLASCDKALDKYPLDQITDNNFWNTANDMELYCNKFYSVFPDHRGSYGGTVLDNNSDNAYTTSSILQGNRTLPSSAGSAGWSFDGVRDCNYFFDNYQRADEKWENIKQYVGEMHFFRAWYYFSLLKKFGDVPWYSHTLELDSPELYNARTPRNVVADSIVADLDKAIEYMETNGGDKTTRIYSDVARAFKSRVCLYEGTWEKYHQGDPFGVKGSDGSKFLQLAVEASKKLMDSGKYRLHQMSDAKEYQYESNGAYATVFNQTDYSSDPEILFWKSYSVDLSFAHNLQYDYPAEGVTKEFVDQFLCLDGLPISLSSMYVGDNMFEDMTRGRDPRIKAYFFQPGEPMQIEPASGDTVQILEKPTLSGSYTQKTGYEIKKARNLDPNMWGSSAGTTGAIAFRYGEVLLNYIEAKACLGDVSQTDIDLTINALRTRAGFLPEGLIQGDIPFTDPNWDFPELTPMMNEIRRERRVELGMEQFRFDDICRWAAAKDLIIGKRMKGALFIKDKYPEVNVGTDIYLDDEGYLDPTQPLLPSGFLFKENRDYLSPLPLEELTLNPNLKQNPNW